MSKRMRDCARCKGTGSIRCGLCGGSGILRIDRYEDGSRADDWQEPCGDCGGSGQMSCEDCGGSGEG